MTSPLYLSVNGARAVSADVMLPYYGVPVGDVSLALDAPLVAPVTVVLGNLSVRMGVLRQRAFAGTLTARLMGGAAGWGRTVGPRAYALGKGVPLSMVLGDVAREVGETISLGADRSVGLFYVRERCPASRVLRQLAGELWWMDLVGVTQVRARPSSAIKSAATVADYRGGKGWLTVATEDPASWVPGATYQSITVPTPITVSATRFHSGDDGTMRMEVLAT